MDATRLSARLLRGVSRLALLALAGCIESYMPDVITANPNYLVVDGFINGNGVTRIRLSRTTTVKASSTPAAEKGASLLIVDNVGTRYALRESSATPGYYLSDSLLLNPARQYQLRLTTSATSSGGANISYASDLTPLKVTPPFDRLGWRSDGSQVQVLVSAHDNNAQSQYYSWSFVETWEFNATYRSVLEYINGDIKPRVTPIYTCWRTERPTFIAQATSSQLSRDALIDQPVLSFSTRDERIKIRYSVLVSQYAETQQEFAYREILRKNTEAVGTVNDPLPSQLTGNMHQLSGNPSEPVLGFVGAHTVQRQRLFIDGADLKLPADWRFNSPYACELFTEYLCIPKVGCIPFPKTRVFSDPSQVPIDYVSDDKFAIAGYSGSRRECVDCRVRGTTTRPSFW